MSSIRCARHTEQMSSSCRAIVEEGTLTHATSGQSSWSQCSGWVGLRCRASVKANDVHERGFSSSQWCQWASGGDQLQLCGGQCGQWWSVGVKVSDCTPVPVFQLFFRQWSTV